MSEREQNRKQRAKDGGRPSVNEDRAGAGPSARSLPPKLASELPSATAPDVQAAVAVQRQLAAASIQRDETDVFGWGQPRAAGKPAKAAPDQVPSVAAQGVSGSPTALPHQAAIQASFGHHDISGVGAHVGGAAADASTAIGANAYAMGDQVAFRSSPDLFLAAHEAAHVVQQRGGVQLSGGVGQSGDRYEQHADTVAATVVRGDSAAALLDDLTTVDVGPAPSGSGTPVQRQEAAGTPSTPTADATSNAPPDPSMIEDQLYFIPTFASLGQTPEQLQARLDRCRRDIDVIRSQLAADVLERLEHLYTRMQDVVLAASQERVVDSAAAEVGVSEADAPGRQRVIEYTQDIGWGSGVTEQGSNVVFGSAGESFHWCGAFAGSRYVETGGLDPDLATAFSSAASLSNFFAYDWGHRNPNYIQVDGAWLDVREYHATRGSERQWWSESEIREVVTAGGWEALPIRVGDIVVIDNARAGLANHIAMVRAWDPVAGVLETIEGNTAIGVRDHSDQSQTLTDTVDGSAGDRIHGIGRPSIVDLESHTYSNELPVAGA